MPVVAVVGGTGNVGRTMVEVFQSDPRHKVLVLARKAPADASYQFVATDYADVDGMAGALSTNAVDTVVCAINVGSAETSEAQVNAIRAAAKAGTVKRFIVSEWGIVHPPDSPNYAFREASYEALRKTPLEWTRVANGFFMDYWGVSRGLKTNMSPIPDLAVDVAHKKAGIPGTGDETICMIYTYDLARYLAAFVADTDKWEETTYFEGDRPTFNGFVKAAEEILGTKFEVAHNPIEKLEKGEVTELPSHVAAYPFFPKPALQGFMAMFGRWMAQGRADFPADKVRSKKYSEVQPKKLREVIAMWK